MRYQDETLQQVEIPYLTISILQDNAHPTEPANVGVERMKWPANSSHLNPTEH